MSESVVCRAFNVDESISYGYAAPKQAITADIYAIVLQTLIQHALRLRVPRAAADGESVDYGSVDHRSTCLALHSL
jgi:hypothetical protein